MNAEEQKAYDLAVKNHARAMKREVELEREAFEHEVKTQHANPDLTRKPDGSYRNYYLKCAWMGWQQRATLPAHTPAARDWTEDADHENGNYSCLCSTCKQEFTGHKRRVICKACSQKTPADGAVDVVAWRIGFPNGAGYKVYERRQDWAYENYGQIAYEVQDLMTVAQHQRILSAVTTERDAFCEARNCLVEENTLLYEQIADLIEERDRIEKDTYDQCVFLVEALEKIVAIELQDFGADWEEIEDAQQIASDALAAHRAGGAT